MGHSVTNVRIPLCSRRYLCFEWGSVIVTKYNISSTVTLFDCCVTRLFNWKVITRHVQ